jgi:hypothetical protein
VVGGGGGGAGGVTSGTVEERVLAAIGQATDDQGMSVNDVRCFVLFV